MAASNESRVPRRHGTPFAMPIELGKVREFAHAVEVGDPADSDISDVIPPTFLLTASAWHGRYSSLWQDHVRDMANVRHGEQDIEYYGPLPRVGETLLGVQRIGSIEMKRSRSARWIRSIEVITDFRRAEGEAVLGRTRSVILELFDDGDPT